MQEETDAQPELARKTCIPCKGGVPPLHGSTLEGLLTQLGGDWMLVDEHHLEKEFAFATYRAAADFVQVAANIAEEQDHHPDMLLMYRKVCVTVFTHKINGLTLSDFVLAAKIEEAYTSLA